MATEITLPKIFRESSTSMIGLSDPSIAINNLPGKVFASFDYTAEYGTARNLQQYSHLEWGAVEGLAGSKYWGTVRWNGESPSDLANAFPADKDFLCFQQIVEAGMSYDNARLFQSIRFDRMTGVTDPADTNNNQDYWEPMVPWQDGLQYLKSGFNWNNLRTRFSSEAEARKNFDGSAHYYFSTGAYNYRNWCCSGYNEAFFRVPEHTRAYVAIMQSEWAHLAIRRKAPLFSEDMMEGSGWAMSRGASMAGFKWPSPSGTIYKAIHNPVPPQMAYWEGLVYSLFGDGIANWGVLAFNQNMQRWWRSYVGGYADWKTKWKPDGGGIVDYQPGNPSHPPQGLGDNVQGMPPNQEIFTRPLFNAPFIMSQHNRMAGRWMANEINSGSNKWHWPAFEYTINGTTYTGYNGTNNPVNGSLGDASLSTLDNRNHGQHNIINQFQYKKPILLVTNIGGVKKAVWRNPMALVGQSQNVTLAHPAGGTYSFTAVGPYAQCFVL